MKLNKNPIGTEEMKARLSNLWIFIMLNILSADVFSFMLPESASGAPVQVTQGLMLAFAFLMEIPLAMVVLSRILPHRANRLANIIAGAVTILFVIGGGSQTLHYYFFAAVEVLTMLYIILTAWLWKGPEKDDARLAEKAK